MNRAKGRHHPVEIRKQTKELSDVYYNANEIASTDDAAYKNYKINWNPVKTTYRDCI